MDCILLGSGGMMPMPYRFLTTLAVRHHGQLYFFDAGEGCQINLKRAKLGIKALRVLAVSHLHGDHCLGVPGLLMMRAQVADPPPLAILGPPGIERFVSQLQEILGFFINYPIRFIEWHEDSDETAYQDEHIRILWSPLKHTTFCLGYRFEEHARPGKFRLDAAEAIGIPSGPLRGRLQRGEAVVLDSGKRILPEQVVGPPRRGRHICYAVDTRPAPSLHRLCKGVDAAFLDGMFLTEQREEAEEKGHMTVDEAARLGTRAGAHRIILVHISPRYSEEDIKGPGAAALDRFPNAEMGRDLQVYPISYAEDQQGG